MYKLSKFIVFLIFLVSYNTNISAQKKTKKDTVEIANLKQQVEDLKEQLNILIAADSTNNKEKWDRSYLISKQSVFLLSKTYDLNNNLLNDIKLTKQNDVLIDINSPVSGTVGFRLDTILIQILEETVNSQNLTTQVKQKLRKKGKSIISRIFTIAENFFPPAGIIRDVVSALGTARNIPIIGEGKLEENARKPAIIKKLNTAANKEEMLYDEKILVAFKNKAKKYFDYYQALDKENQNFSNNLDSYQSDFEEAKTEIANIKADLNLKFDVTIESQIDRFFNKNNNALSYREKLKSDKVKNIVSHVSSIMTQTDNLLFNIKKYSFARYQYIERVKDVLEKAKELKGANSEKIDKAKNKLDIISYSSKTGTLSTYEEKIQEINTLIQNLKTELSKIL